MNIDPKLDLVLERVLDLTPEQVWKGWTTPEILTKWFCPEPWKTIEAEVDLKLWAFIKAGASVRTSW